MAGGRTDNSVRLRLKLFVLNRLSRMRRMAVGRGAKAILLDTKNGLLLVEVEDMGVGRILGQQGSYGQDDIQRLSQHIRPETNVLVVGSHVGALVIPLSQMCRSVTAVEANPASYRLLEMNLKLNGRSNVRAVNIAAADRVQQLEFVVNKANTGGSKRMPQVKSYIYFSDQPDVISISAAPLDEVFSGEKFDVVLLDIEGSEYFALKGMQRILREARALYIEFTPHHLKNVAGVSPAEFVAQMEPHFDRMFLTGKDRAATKAEFGPVLQEMYDRDEGDDGIIFTKA